MIRAKAGVTAVYLKALKCLVKFPREIYASLIISPSLSRLITQGKEYPRPKISCLSRKNLRGNCSMDLGRRFYSAVSKICFVQSLRISPPEIFVSITRSGKGILRKRSPPSSVKFLPMARGEDSLRLSVDAYQITRQRLPEESYCRALICKNTEAGASGGAKRRTSA